MPSFLNYLESDEVSRTIPAADIAEIVQARSGSTIIVLKPHPNGEFRPNKPSIESLAALTARLNGLPEADPADEPGASALASSSTPASVIGPGGMLISNEPPQPVSLTGLLPEGHVDDAEGEIDQSAIARLARGALPGDHEHIDDATLDALTKPD